MPDTTRTLDAVSASATRRVIDTGSVCVGTIVSEPSVPLALSDRRESKGHFGQREQQHGERDEAVGDGDVHGVLNGNGKTDYGRLAKNARTASAIFAPTTAANSSRVARRTPARLPNV